MHIIAKPYKGSLNDRIHEVDTCLHFAEKPSEWFEEVSMNPHGIENLKRDFSNSYNIKIGCC